MTAPGAAPPHPVRARHLRQPDLPLSLGVQAELDQPAQQLPARSTTSTSIASSVTTWPASTASRASPAASGPSPASTASALAATPSSPYSST